MRISNRLLITAIAAFAMALHGCGTERRGSGGGGSRGGSGEGEGEGEGPAEGEGEGEGPAEGEGEGGGDGSSVTGTFVTEDGGQSAENSTDAPARGTFAAVIQGSQITLWLLAAEGRQMLFVLDASDIELPGTFELQSGLEGSYGTLTELGTTPRIYETQTGSISIDNCAIDEGDTIRGSFSNVSFGEVEGDGSRQLDGSFSTEIIEVQEGDVRCSQVGEGEGEGEGEGGGQCQWNEDTVCQTPQQAPCCPFIQAVGQCMIGCAFEACMMNPSAAGCLACTTGCVEDTDAACRSAWGALLECSNENGCDELEDETSADMCNAAFCCDEAGRVGS